MLWPGPHRQSFLGLETVGYSEDVVLPIDVRLTDPAAPARLDLKGAVYVCSEICTRVELGLAAEAAPDAAGDPGAAARIEAFRARVPGDGAAVGIALTDASVVQMPSGAALRVVATAREPFVAPDLFVETGSSLAFGAPRVRFADGRRRAELTAPLAEPLPRGTELAGKAAILTLVDGGRAAEARTIVATAPATDAGGWGAEDSGLAGLGAILGTALLGGLLLNLMPCVLPVLSLKMLSIIGHGGAPRREIRLGFLASATGILASFLVLSTAMAGLKAAGAAVGWGIQFQQPLFLVLLVLLLTLFAANLLGLFEVALPYRLASMIGSGSRVGGNSLLGHFATGAVATLLATPCSAPFLGTAVGFALAQGPMQIYAVFATLGLGLALPLLVVAAFPGAAAWLPRPGRWMLALRRGLALLLGLSAAWLLSVLAAQAGLPVALLVAALMAALVLTLWGSAGVHHRRSCGLATATAAILAGATFLAPLAAQQVVGTATAARPRSAAGLDWVRFDAAEIGHRVAAGEVVFVEVTADWCITCKVNERLVLADEAVARRLGAAGVAAMLADWTRPDPAISDYLKRFRRYGIPFTAVYGPAAPDGIVLPELLSVERVLNALDAAAGGAS